MSKPFDEQPTVRIQHDLNDTRVFESYAKMVSQRVLQFADKAG